MPVKLLVVGGGKMGGALVGGLVGSGWSAPSGVGVVEPVPERRQELAALHPGLVTLAAPEPGIVEPGGGAVLAVKPEAAEVACRALAAAGVGRVLSVVAAWRPSGSKRSWHPGLPSCGPCPTPR